MSTYTEARDKYFKENPLANAATLVLAIGIVAIIFPVWLLWNAAIMWFGWEWFAVPLGAPEINMWHAIGVGVFITWITTRPIKLKDGDSLAIVWLDIKRDIYVLATMWVVHFLI